MALSTERLLRLPHLIVREALADEPRLFSLPVPQRTRLGATMLDRYIDFTSEQPTEQDRAILARTVTLLLSS